MLSTSHASDDLIDFMVFTPSLLIPDENTREPTR
jgi:hypothetical protein